MIWHIFCFFYPSHYLLSCGAPIPHCLLQGFSTNLQQKLSLKGTSTLPDKADLADRQDSGQTLPSMASQWKQNLKWVPLKLKSVGQTQEKKWHKAQISQLQISNTPFSLHGTFSTHLDAPPLFQKSWETEKVNKPRPVIRENHHCINTPCSAVRHPNRQPVMGFSKDLIWKTHFHECYPDVGISTFNVKPKTNHIILIPQGGKQSSQRARFHSFNSKQICCY